MLTALNGFVERVNYLMGRRGHVIETEERADLMRFIEDICWATRQIPLLEETENWRTW